jgi:trehalose 6-phosphate phosphatase
VTVHYRHAARQRRTVAAIDAAVRSPHGARSLGGKHAVSLVPRLAPTKGAALERARRLLACDTAIYAGDDQTDEDAFSAAHADGLLGIRVGARRQSQARYYLRNQAEIDALLRALLAFRPRRFAARPSAGPRLTRSRAIRVMEHR